jgi:hypothetical protein
VKQHKSFKFSPEQIRSLASFLVFYGGWWGVTILLGREAFSLVILLTIISLAIHCAMYRRPFAELIKLIVLGGIGAFIDGGLVTLGLFEFYRVPLPWLLPIWLIFAASIAGYGTAFRGRMWALGGLAAVFGPLSYMACIPLGLVRYPEPYALHIGLHGLYWFLALPIFVMLRQYWDERWKTQ